MTTFFFKEMSFGHYFLHIIIILQLRKTTTISSQVIKNDKKNNNCPWENYKVVVNLNTEIHVTCESALLTSIF